MINIEIGIRSSAVFQHYNTYLFDPNKPKIGHNQFS